MLHTAATEWQCTCQEALLNPICGIVDYGPHVVLLCGVDNYRCPACVCYVLVVVWLQGTCCCLTVFVHRWCSKGFLGSASRFWNQYIQYYENAEIVSAWICFRLARCWHWMPGVGIMLAKRPWHSPGVPWCFVLGNLYPCINRKSFCSFMCSSWRVWSINTSRRQAP